MTVLDGDRDLANPSDDPEPWYGRVSATIVLTVVALVAVAHRRFGAMTLRVR